MTVTENLNLVEKLEFCLKVIASSVLDNFGTIIIVIIVCIVVVISIIVITSYVQLTAEGS